MCTKEFEMNIDIKVGKILDLFIDGKNIILKCECNAGTFGVQIVEEKLGKSYEHYMQFIEFVKSQSKTKQEYHNWVDLHDQLSKRIFKQYY